LPTLLSSCRNKTSAVYANRTVVNTNSGRGAANITANKKSEKHNHSYSSSACLTFKNNCKFVLKFSKDPELYDFIDRLCRHDKNDDQADFSSHSKIVYDDGNDMQKRPTAASDTKHKTSRTNNNNINITSKGNRRDSQLDLVNGAYSGIESIFRRDLIFPEYNTSQEFHCHKEFESLDTSRSSSNNNCLPPLVPKPSDFTIDHYTFGSETEAIEPTYSCMQGLDCCLPCIAASALYPANQLTNAIAHLFPLNAASLVLSTILFISYLVLPNMRHHPKYMIMYNTASIMAAQICRLAPFFVNIETIFCASANSIEDPSFRIMATQSSNVYCTLQGVVLMFACLATLMWWLALIVNLHLVSCMDFKTHETTFSYKNSNYLANGMAKRRVITMYPFTAHHMLGLPQPLLHPGSRIPRYPISLGNLLFSVPRPLQHFLLLPRRGYHPSGLSYPSRDEFVDRACSSTASLSNLCRHAWEYGDE
jgi:hypothetical protein